MYRVLVIHRNTDFVQFCRTVLKTAGFTVENARTAEQANQAFYRNAPSAIVLDMSDEQIEGIRIMQKLRGNSTIPVILLTDSAEEIDEIMGLRLGADTVLRQPVSAHLLTEWIRSLVKRHDMLVGTSDGSQTMISSINIGQLAMDPDRFTAMWRGEEISLTITEFKLLAALAARPGVVRSRESLLEFIHDRDEYVDDRSIDSHVKRIRSKIRDLAPEFNCIQTVYGLGYRYNPQALRPGFTTKSGHPMHVPQ
ncbi:MAG: response regulator transcription factor [Pseudorhodobacter sp.]